MYPLLHNRNNSRLLCGLVLKKKCMYSLIDIFTYLLFAPLQDRDSTSGRKTALRIPVLSLENSVAEMESTLGWK